MWLQLVELEAATIGGLFCYSFSREPCGVECMIARGQLMFVLPTVRLLLIALAVATGFGILLQLNAFRSETRPPSSVVGAEAGFSYIKDLQKDAGLPEQIRQAVIVERVQPEAKTPETATNEPAVSIPVAPLPDSRGVRTFAVAQVPLQTLRTCLAIEDQSKERLDCYDEKIAPAPKQVSAPAKTVRDCRFVQEEDERLNCFNRFVSPPPKKSTAQKAGKKP